MTTRADSPALFVAANRTSARHCYVGQVRAARPQVLYTSVAGNDTVPLLSQMQEFGLLNNLSLVGASGPVTSQNISAIGKAAEGFVTGVGYSTEIASPENKKFDT